MKRRSTHKGMEEEKEEEDNSGDSDAATTKPKSRSLKALLSFNKFGNKEDTTKAAGGDSSNYRSDRRKFVLRGKQPQSNHTGTSTSRGGGTISATRSTQSGRGGTDTNTGRTNPIRSTRSGRVGTDTNTGRGDVSNSASQSTQSGRRGTVDTDTHTGRGGSNKKTTTYHNSNVELSPSSSSSSSKSSSSKSSKGSNFACSSSDDDDDDDDDYVDKGGKKRKQSSGKKMEGRKKKKGGKKEAVESPEVLKAAEFPLTLRVAFIPRKRATSTTPTAFNSISNADYTYHQYTSGLTTSSTLEEVYTEIDSVLPTDILGRVDGKSLFYDSACVSVHPINFGVVSKAKSKHVDPITDDNELLDAISCGGLKLESTPERAEEPKTVEMLEAIDEEGEEDSTGSDVDDEDESNNYSGSYYHLDLIVFCVKKDKNRVTSGTGTRKSNPIEYIRINLLPLTVSLKGAKHNEESKYEYYPKDKANHNFGTLDIPVKDFCQGKRYCHIRHMMQEEYIKGDGDIRDNISAISAIFIRTNAGSRNMIKITSTAHLLTLVDAIKSRARPMTADVGNSKAVVTYLSLGWKRTDDPPAGDFDLDNQEDDERLAAGSQQPVFHASPVTKKSHHQKNKEKRKASQTSSNEGLQIFHWLYSHKDSPYLHKLPLEFRPPVIEEYKDDTNERSRIMALIDDGIEDLETTDFPSIEYLKENEKLNIFFPLHKEYPPTNGGLPTWGLKSGKAGTRPKTMDVQLGEQVGGLVKVVGTLAKQLGTGHREAEFICITRDNTSYSLPVSEIKPNRINERHEAAAVAVSPVAPVVANCVTGLDVLKKFAAETKAKRIGLFPRASSGGINIYTFDGSEFRSDQFQQLSLKTIIKVTGNERTKKIVMTIVQEQTVPDEDDYDVAF